VKEMKRIKPVTGHLVTYPASSPQKAAAWPNHTTITGYEAGVGLVVDTPGIWLVVLGPGGDVYSGIRRDSVEVISV